MSAADDAQWIEQKARWLAALPSLVRMALIVAVFTGVGYCSGQCATGKQQAVAVNTSQRTVVAKAITVHDTVFRHDTVYARQTARQATIAHDSARVALGIAQEAIHRAHGAHSDSLPTVDVLPAVEACQTAVRADSIAYVALHQALVTMTAERDDWKRADSLDVAKLKLVKAPRFGWRSGAVLGAAAVALLVHLVK